MATMAWESPQPGDTTSPSTELKVRTIKTEMTVQSLTPRLQSKQCSLGRRTKAVMTRRTSSRRSSLRTAWSPQFPPRSHDWTPSLSSLPLRNQAASWRGEEGQEPRPVKLRPGRRIRTPGKENNAKSFPRSLSQNLTVFLFLSQSQEAINASDTI